MKRIFATQLAIAGAANFCEADHRKCGEPSLRNWPPPVQRTIAAQRAVTIEANLRYETNFCQQN